MISKLNQSHNEWITKSIKVSRKRKKKSFLSYVRYISVINLRYTIKNIVQYYQK